MSIAIKTQEQIEIMREGGKLLAKIMHELESNIHPGIDTLTLDKLAEKLILDCNGIPAFKGYGAESGDPFPGTICASINDEVVHGIPSKGRIVNNGDILKIDIGMKYRGLFLDMARTFAIGNVDSKIQELIDATKGCFFAGIKALKDGAKLSGYSKSVEKYIKPYGFGIVRNLVGHGIGEDLHEEPQIPNYYEKAYRDITLKAGMTLALEPMINMGTFKTQIGADGWVYETADGKFSAHYENTILITKNGVEVLTQ